MNYSLQENDTLELVPISIRKKKDDFIIIKKENMTTLVTPKAGELVIKQIASGASLSRIKDIVAKEYNIEKSTVNINPIVQMLIENGFISRIGANIILEEKARWFINLNYFFKIILRASFFEFLLNRDRIHFAYPLLKRNFFGKIEIDQMLLASAHKSFVESGISKFRFIRKFENLHKQITFDKTLFFKLNYDALTKWFNNYFIVEKEHTFINLQKQQTIYCAYHIGRFELLPFILAKYGIEVDSPVAYKDEFYLQLLERTTAIKESIYKKAPQLYSRSEKDGIILFRALKNGKNILLFCDTHILLTDDFLKVEFLCKNIKVNRGVAALHMRTKVPIVPVITYNKGNRCYIKFMPQIDYEKDISEYEITQRLFNILENHVKRFPHQWAKWHDLEKMIVE